MGSSENVANVEVLPVPMLPMANGAGGSVERAKQFRRALPGGRFINPRGYAVAR